MKNKSVFIAAGAVVFAAAFIALNGFVASPVKKNTPPVFRVVDGKLECITADSPIVVVKTDELINEDTFYGLKLAGGGLITPLGEASARREGKEVKINTTYSGGSASAGNSSAGGGTPPPTVTTPSTGDGEDITLSFGIGDYGAYFLDNTNGIPSYIRVMDGVLEYYGGNGWSRYDTISNLIASDSFASVSLLSSGITAPFAAEERVERSGGGIVIYTPSTAGNSSGGSPSVSGGGAAETPTPSGGEEWSGDYL